MSKSIPVTIRGVVKDVDSAQPIYNAKIRHPPTRASVQSSADGTFEIVVMATAGTRTLRLTVLKNDHWARRVECTVPESGAIDVGTVDLRHFSTFMTDKFFGQLAAFLGPRLHSWLLGRTDMEIALLSVLTFFLVPPLMLLAIARGWDVPRTEIDEEVREFMQARQWPVASSSEVSFAGIRKVYRPHVRYRIRKGDYKVEDTVVVEADSEISIEKGTTFKMARNTGFQIRGRFVARGEVDGRISFIPADSNAPWLNLTFWEKGSAGSVLEHCLIRGGSGRAVSGNPENGGLRLDNGNTKNGGGLLFYNTSVSLAHVNVEECSAAFGGGIYVRNSKDRAAELTSSRFIDLTVKNCRVHLEGELLVGGGGVFVQRAAPEFIESKFENNEVKGNDSCGGGVYIGTDARAKFTGCTFANNKSTASGGGLYARECAELDDEFTSGVFVQDSKFLDNRAGGLGGGMAVENARVRLSNVIFSRNVVGDFIFKGTTAPLSRGGGLALAYDNAFISSRGKNLRRTMVENCRFESNETAVPGTAAYSPENFAGGGLSITSALPLKLFLGDLAFTNNKAPLGRHAATSSPGSFDGWNGQWESVNPDGVLKREAGAVHVINRSTISALTIDRSHSLPDNCYGERPPSTPIDTIILHFISASSVRPEAPYNLDAVLGIFTSETEGRTSAHYLIDRDGAVYELVPETKAAWHAGASRMPDGREKVNNFSLGIEIMHRIDDPPTEAQYKSLTTLIHELKGRHNIPLSQIVGHELVRSLWNKHHPEALAPEKRDPGPTFHWSSLLNNLITSR